MKKPQSIVACAFKITTCLTLTGVLFALSGTSGILAETLQGSVSYQTMQQNTQPIPASPQQFGYPMMITDESTGEGIGGVDVWMPQQNYKTTSDEHGRFRLPVANGQDTIARFKKEGFAPKSMTFEDGRLNHLPQQSGQFQVTLQKSQSTIVLDDTLRHLGDGSFASNSAGTSEFRGQAGGPVFTKKFRLNGQLETNSLTLTIGSVIGLDTMDAQRLGQSRFHKSSSPMTVTLNGHIIGSISTNGDGHRLRVRSHQLDPSGVNTLAIHTGYHRPDGVRVDYDDMELMLLTLDFSG